MKQLEGVIYPTLRSRVGIQYFLDAAKNFVVTLKINGSAGTPQMLCETSTTSRLQVGKSSLNTPEISETSKVLSIDDQITLKRWPKPW